MNQEQQDILSKRFQTTMIGAIYEFEENFGYLWGHQKDNQDLTKQEENFRLKWENTRNQILNNGNNQLRKCIKDLGDHSSTKFNYKFYNRRRG
jgi:hypothetical protein